MYTGFETQGLVWEIKNHVISSFATDWTVVSALRKLKDTMDRDEVHSETMSSAILGSMKCHRKFVGVHRRIIKVVTLHYYYSDSDKFQKLSFWK